MNELVRNHQALDPEADEFSRDISPAEASAMDIETNRAAQQVQASLVIAKKFPRDETKAFNRIIQSCRRKSLAEQAAYVYPRAL